jgi:E3 ubiquitin-protein ligase MARCH6
MRATAAVTEKGEPFDEEARKLIQAQNLEAEKAKRNIGDDYIIVYLPPGFRHRVILFIFCLWAVGAASLGVFVALPIILGRLFFKLFISDDVHDGYSFIVGFYLLWACYLVGKSIDRLDKRRQRRVDVGPRSTLSLYVVKRALLWIPKAIYMVIFLGIVIPILIAFAVDLYVVLPIRLALNPHLTPRIRVVDMWALGIVYINIFLHVYRLQAESWLTVGIQNVSRVTPSCLQHMAECFHHADHQQRLDTLGPCLCDEGNHISCRRWTIWHDRASCTHLSLCAALFPRPCSP